MIHTLLVYVRNLLTINTHHMKMEEYTNYYINKCGNDIELASKLVRTNAELALEEGDLEDFETSTEVFQRLEVIKSNRVA